MIRCRPDYDSYYSWGGHSVIVDGTYHLYASFMCNHKTLNDWTTASSSAHFVSANPDGPFEWAPEDCNASGVCTPPIQPWR